MTTTYHLDSIKTLLTEGFSDEDLRLFCYDQPDFSPIYERLTKETDRAALIDLLVSYLERNLKIEALLQWAQETNPTHYEAHQPYVKTGTSAQPQAAGASEPVAVIHLYTFGDLPPDLPENALNWTAHFDRATQPRTVPGPQTWETDLLPALQARRAQIGQRGLIEIRTPGGALPAGFAIGHTFQEVGQYQLAVEQDSGPLWRSDAPPEKTHQPDWASYILPGNPAKPDAAVVILAIPDRTIEAVAGAVGTYFDEGETFQTFFQQTTYDYGALEEALTTGFTVEALRSLIAGSAALAPLLGQAATDAGSAALAAHLVQYARQQMLEAELVALIRQGNPRRYARVAGRLFKQPGQSDHLKGALFLVAGAIEAEDRFIADWEAAALARTSRAHLIDFVAQVRPQTVHLFLAAPFALAAFLGHRWNAINTVLQCYDFVGGEKSYAPACRLII